MNLIIYYPTPNFNQLSRRAKTWLFPVFRLHFGQTWAKIASNYILPLAPSIFSYPGKQKFLNFFKTLIFLNFNLARAWKKLFLRIAIKFVSNNSLPPAPCFPGQPNLAKLGENLFLETSIYKHLRSLVFSNFDFFLQFGQTW